MELNKLDSQQLEVTPFHFDSEDTSQFDDSISLDTSTDEEISKSACKTAKTGLKSTKTKKANYNSTTLMPDDELYSPHTSETTIKKGAITILVQAELITHYNNEELAKYDVDFLDERKHKYEIGTLLDLLITVSAFKNSKNFKSAELFKETLDKMATCVNTAGITSKLNSECSIETDIARLLAKQHILNKIQKVCLENGVKL